MQDINRPELGVKEYFDKILKDKQIDFISENNLTEYLYTLMIGSAYGKIQLDLTNDLNNAEVVYQTWTVLSEKSYEQFGAEIYWAKNWDEIKDNIDHLIDKTKNIIRAKNKINSLFDEVRDIIEEYNLGISFNETAESIL